MIIACSRQTLNAAFKRFQLLPLLPSQPSQSGPPGSLEESSGIRSPSRGRCAIKKASSVQDNVNHRG